MEQKELQKLLNQPYNQENWKKIVMDVFPNVSILSTPKVFPINNPKIEKFSQLGNVRLHDGKNLALFELILNVSVNLSRNRVELNNEISKYIDQEQIHGVLSVFEQGNDDYRFTFSARSTEFDEQEGDFVSKKTDTKRFTYVLGKNESCRTAAERFHQLGEKKDEATIKAIQNAFSVEQVSKEFFDKYTKQFKKFWTYLASIKEYNYLFDHSDKAKQEHKIRDFTKKLLGRIVFLHFLQKKEWLGCKAGVNEWIDGDKRFMQNLYESFSDKEHFYSQSLSKLFFEVLNKRRAGDIFNIAGLEGNLNGTKVPYLNGGLFDTDEDISKKIDFPQEYFENLLNFFGEYNFTIDENDPNDHEVGIDPEMLGHIFENLLEDNKDKGAFYTPKAIVQYMCQESIIEYLKTSLNLTETQKDKQEAITELIHDNLAEHVSDYDMVAPIAQALYDVKVCDPAIGSGAFPMGILNTIYQAVENLYYLQPDSVAPIWKISETEWQPHLVKKDIIQHSIYGVDIESGAVDIARLRFWLALVVDETEPLPLPNLDYKIMQGDSLLESFEGIDLSQISNASAYEAEYESEQLDIFTGEAKKKFQISIHFEDIEALMELYFNANNAEEKKEIHKKIDEQITNHIRFTLLEHRKEIEEKTKKLQKDLKYKEAAASNWEQKEKIRIDSKDAKELVKLNKELSLYTNKEIALSKLSTSNERPFFLWHLFFKDVFDDGGFDIVIGNPPYMIIFDKELKLQLENNYESFKRNNDIYIAFFQFSTNILKKNKGVLSFITPNTFLNGDYFKSFRVFLNNSAQIIEIRDFKNSKVFQDPTVFVSISILKSNDLKSKLPYSFNLKASNNKSEDNFSIIINSYSDKPFKVDNIIMEKIFENKDVIILDDYFFVKDVGFNYWTKGRGKKRNESSIGNRVFYSDNKKHMNDIPFIKGRDIEMFFIGEPSNYLIHNYKEKLNKNDTFRYSSDFLLTKPKIIYRQTSNRIIAAIDNNGLLNDKTVHIIVPKKIGLSIDLYGVLGLMNSKLFEYLYRYISQETEGRAFAQVKTTYIKKLPVLKNIDSSFINLVKNIIILKSENKDFSIEKKQIDDIVYKLYKLSFEEILVVEPEFSDRMSKAEYEALVIE